MSKRGTKKNRKTELWICDECRAGYPDQCVRPEHCEAAQERRRAEADFLLDQMKEDGRSPF